MSQKLVELVYVDSVWVPIILQNLNSEKFTVTNLYSSGDVALYIVEVESANETRGLSVVKELHERHPNTKIIAFGTDLGTKMELSKQLIDAGADEVWSKDAITRLVALVDRLLA